jgi:hypothetical protein
VCGAQCTAVLLLQILSRKVGKRCAPSRGRTMDERNGTTPLQAVSTANEQLEAKAQAAGGHLLQLCLSGTNKTKTSSVVFSP